MRDIALGIQEHGLEVFAASVNASFMDQWIKLGFYDKTEESWGRAFEQVLTKTLAVGGRFHFNLTGLDIAGALKGDPEFWVDRYTAWELQQIVRNHEWFDNTLFYLDGNLLTQQGVRALGIEPHND
jgi:hypothetical protein